MIYSADRDMVGFFNVPLTLSPTKPVIPGARALQRPSQPLCRPCADFGSKLGGDVTDKKKKKEWRNNVE